MINYRKAQEEDSEKIANLLIKRFNIITKEEGVEAFKKEYDKDEIFIAEEDGKVLGLLSWQMRGLPKHQLVSIERIAVLQGPKLHEIGENLFRKAMEEADRLFKSQDLKVRKAFCMIHKDNKTLKEFYESLGFIIEATLKDHFYKGKDEYMLSIFFE